MNSRIALALGLALSLFTQAAAAQAYPSKPVRWIVAWPPGGANDIFTRSIADDLSRTLGQPMVVENRPGATGTIGSDMVAKAASDGYTLTLGATGTFSTAPAIFPALPYDPVKDFTHISQVAVVPNVLAVHPSVPATTVAQLIAHLKANPGKLNYSSVGNGSTFHLAAELFNRMAGVDTVHVAYKGSQPAQVDLLGGRIQIAFDSMPAMLPHHRSGAVRVLAVTPTQRSRLMPEVPTVAETLPGFDVTIWYGVFGPAGMPADVTQTLNRALHAAMKKPEIAKRFNDLGAEVVLSTPEGFRQHVASDTAKWTQFIRAAGIKAN
jgi:tripartite-type tricarboxylate transporter receptor subunit TctC